MSFGHIAHDEWPLDAQSPIPLAQQWINEEIDACTKTACGVELAVEI